MLDAGFVVVRLFRKKQKKNNPSGCCMLHKVRDAALFFISIQRVKMTTDSSPGG